MICTIRALQPTISIYIFYNSILALELVLCTQTNTVEAGLQSKKLCLSILWRIESFAMSRYGKYKAKHHDS
jgi:hypothetical protein